jgi:hypothetical protein
MQSLRYLQGFALGDGWVHNGLDRFKLHVYDEKFASKIRRLQKQAKTKLGLLGSEWKGVDHRNVTPVWIFEIGGPLATKNLDLGLLRSPEGLHFLAGLWDADGNWSPPDESHPMGQTRIFGGYHTVRYTKHWMKLQWGFRTGRMYIATPEGHISHIGEHVIYTRTNVYGTGVLTKSMAAWVQLVGSKMLLKGRSFQLGNSLPSAESTTEGTSY